MTYVPVGLAYFLYVFCRAFQQRNVVYNKYALVAPFSFALAAIDVFVISSIAFYGFKWGLVVAMTCGGTTGAMAAMYLHTRWIT